MAQNTNLREMYASMAEAKLRSESVFASLFNNKYNGTPAAGAVKIPVRTDASAADYDIANGTALNAPGTSYETLVLDNDKAVNELIDGYVAEAVPDDLVAERIDSAGYALGTAVDVVLLDCLGDATGEYVQNANIIKSIIKTCAKAKKAGVDPKKIWIVIAPDIEADVITDTLFVHASSDLKDGNIGFLGGYPVRVSARLNDESFVVGNSDFCHFVATFAVAPEVVDLKDGVHIGASAVQGRYIFGCKLSKPSTVFVKGTIPSI